MKLFKVNDNLQYVENPHVDKNTFIGQEVDENKPLPTYADNKDKLPRPVWEGHESAIGCYYKAWEIAFRNLRKANKEAGFVSDFIDTAFNGYLFMWDSSFIVMFGKYARHIFDFHKTLDNFYSHQHKDGFICREICEKYEGEQWTRDDPCSTGPNVLPWAEWEYYLLTGDKERIAKVFDPLLAYHKWLQLNRSWQDGGYWSCGNACGMDNQPRQEKGYNPMQSHGFMTWIDTCAQMWLSGSTLIKMGKLLGREEETDWLKVECDMLEKLINEKMWDENTSFYYDKYRYGDLSKVKTIGAYWTLLSGLVPEQRAERFVAHLDNEKEFKRPNRIPSLSADTPEYNAETGGYWLGGVWAPTNYMVLKGLTKYGFHDLAYEIATDYLKNVVKVFEETDTLWENYAPEKAAKGQAKANFVGWTGLAPINVMFEYVFGIQADMAENKIVWRVNLTDEHGIENYPFGDTTITLIAAKRNNKFEEPEITVKSDKPITIEVYWNGGNKTLKF